MGKYDDIINLPHPISKNHPQMSQYNRAAQFAPFAALVGYAEAIKASEINYVTRTILSEDEKQKIEDSLHNIHKGDDIEISYFSPTISQTLGQYLSFKGKVKNIDLYTHQIIFDDKTKINIKEIKSVKINKDATK